jgi:hypothetical protein
LKVEEFFDQWYKKKFEPSKRVVVPITTFANTNFQVTISFDEKRSRAGLFGFSKVEEKVRWEQWVIPFSVLKTAPTDARGNLPLSRKLISTKGQKERLENDLRKIMLSIVSYVNQNRNQIPPLASKELTPFPYEV